MDYNTSGYEFTPHVALFPKMTVVSLEARSPSSLKTQLHYEAQTYLKSW